MSNTMLSQLSQFKPQFGKMVVLTESPTPWYGDKYLSNTNTNTNTNTNSNIPIDSNNKDKPIDKSEDELSLKMESIKSSCKRILTMIILVGLIILFSRMYCK